MGYFKTAAIIFAINGLLLTGVMADTNEIKIPSTVIAQVRGTYEADTFSVMGDMNLDGISSSAGDLAAYYSLFACLFIFAPVPEEIVTQSDINCDSIFLSVADLVQLWSVILHEVDPCYGGMGIPTGGGFPPVESNLRGEAYSIAVDDTHFEGTDTGWVDIVIVKASETFSGFQFHLEYETDQLLFLEAQIGEDFSQWGEFHYREDTSGNTADLRIVGIALDFDSTSMELSLPPLPTPVVRLKFEVTAPDNIGKDINFVWDYCGDNSLAVSDPAAAYCFWPEYLAVSRNVLDTEGNDITGGDTRYGGVDDICLSGGSESQPVRYIDFKSGQLSYSPSCCMGRRGNVDNLDDVNVADLTYLVNYLFKGGPAPECPEEANVDGISYIDVSDLTYLVDYLFKGGPEPVPCP